VTVGEKIGKSHLTYAQGACAELVAMITIRLADTQGWPVSTTHVLSSGIAGTMAANRFGSPGPDAAHILMGLVAHPAGVYFPGLTPLRLRQLYRPECAGLE